MAVVVCFVFFLFFVYSFVCLFVCFFFALKFLNQLDFFCFRLRPHNVKKLEMKKLLLVVGGTKEV